MAYVKLEYCNICKRQTYHVNSVCRGCVGRRRIAIEDAWNLLSVEEKINNVNKRLKAIEDDKKHFNLDSYS